MEKFYSILFKRGVYDGGRGKFGEDRKMLFKCIVKRRFFLVDVIFKSKKVKVLYRFYSIEFGLVLILG